MKKYLILRIIFLTVAILLVTTLFYNLFYFNNFYKNVRPITQAEKQKIIEILNKSMNIEDYQIKFGNIYNLKNKEVAQIELIKNNSKKGYFVDIKENRIVKK